MFSDAVLADLLMASTYKLVIEYFAESVLQDAKVHFNEEVVGIENVVENEERGVNVRTSAGFEAHFDHVVVSCTWKWADSRCAFVISVAAFAIMEEDSS